MGLAHVTTKSQIPEVISDSGATQPTFGVTARAHFLVPGILVEAANSTILTAGGRVPLTHTGTAAACMAHNDGTKVYISTEKPTFTNHMTENMALWAERSLVEMGFAIFRDKSGCWLSRHGYIAVTDGRSIRMNEGTRPGAYLLDTTHGDGYSAAQNYANFMAQRAVAPTLTTGGRPKHPRSRPGLACWGPATIRGPSGQSRPPRRTRGDVAAIVTGANNKGEYRLPHRHFPASPKPQEGTGYHCRKSC
jgi:hypothetical protein